ncbi:MAG: DUF6261 family protein, partial [Puniceicoccales bacterium]|nr:DUF6261 family protein [Puniceicoccales bacterium]
MFSDLRNEEHFGFHSEFAKLANEYTLTEAFVALVARYNARYDELNDALEITRTSSFTRQLVTADLLRISAYRRLRTAVRGHLRYTDPAKNEAAWRIYDIFRQYGNLAQSARDKRTYGLTNLLEDLRERTAAELQTLGVTAWVSELETKNQAYKSLKESRYAEWEAQPVKTVRECRVAQD